MMRTQTRAPKQIGDFGEGLSTYAFIRKGFEVAMVDHVGADLIGEKQGLRYAVSVKTRLFRFGSKESRGVVIERSHLEKLEHFANQFDMIPLFALVLCLADEQAVHPLLL